ncbi:MAG: hypothetical protein NCW75_07360 [Phycisphaera sp.]|nr:MAG: hypothetical protein NCW75_07360 [Phycisphaera sp.]
MRTDAIAKLTMFLLLAGAPIACSQQAEQSTPPPAAAQSVEFDNAEQVLTALEDADDELRTFSSGIMYTTIKDIGYFRTRRTGDIAFASDAAKDGTPRRRFAVHFVDALRGDRYSDGPDALQTIAFDGRWLWDVIHAQMQINKREIVPQGETIDPFELGDGPFPPLPIGQQKDDILRRYTVRLVPQTESLEPDPNLDPEDPFDRNEVDFANGLVSFASGSVQLLLIPKQRGGEARFSEIRLWYKPDSSGRLLPRMSRTVDANSNDVSIVQLMHPLQVNGPAREDLLTITPPKGWTVNETPLPPPPVERTTGTDPRDAP